MSVLNCTQFTQLLVDQTPVYDKLILADIRPTDGWIGHVSTGRFPAFSDSQLVLDRFNHVFPDTTYQWNRVTSQQSLTTEGQEGCGDTSGGYGPCDPTEHCIGWGNTRVTYYLEKQSWQTPLLCFDQMMHVTHAKEHFRQIISDILKPATSAIMSGFLRKRAEVHAGRKWVADANMTQYTGTWSSNANGQEIYYTITSTAGAAVMPTSKLTPQMLQRRVHPLMLSGYMGKQPFKDMPPLIELVTDMETTWDLDKQAGSASTLQLADGTTANYTLPQQWRFTDWSEANKYWKYGFQGQLGNYAIRVDPTPLRFVYIGNPTATSRRFQLLLPYQNVAATNGLRSSVNDDYQNAPYQISIIWHRQALQILVSDSSPVNPEMPFSARDFGGKWQFVMDNLGACPNTGIAIDNRRRNKGQFIADFKLAAKPMYTEFCEAIFHLREPACVNTIDICSAQSYSAQSYDSCNDTCADDDVEGSTQDNVTN